MSRLAADPNVTTWYRDERHLAGDTWARSSGRQNPKLACFLVSDRKTKAAMATIIEAMTRTARAKTTNLMPAPFALAGVDQHHLSTAAGGLRYSHFIALTPVPSPRRVQRKGPAEADASRPPSN